MSDYPTERDIILKRAKNLTRHIASSFQSWGNIIGVLVSIIVGSILYIFLMSILWFPGFIWAYILFIKSYKHKKTADMRIYYGSAIKNALWSWIYVSYHYNIF